MKMRQNQDAAEQDMSVARSKIFQQIKNYGKSQEPIDKLLNEETDICRKERQDRVDEFLKHLNHKRNSYIWDAKLSNEI